MGLIKKAVYLERSPAKINLYLDILSKRDDGYHNIETVFQAIDLEDHLTFEISVDCAETEDDISDAIDFEIEIDSNNEVVKSLGLTNSVTKALEAYFAVMPEDTPPSITPNPAGTGILDMISSVKIDVFIDKNIPLEAGLAGGSGNAAATLRALNTFFEDNFNWSLSQKELMKLAADIGSDVPFCLQSLEEPRSFGELRGEKLSSVTEASKKIKLQSSLYDKHSQLIIVKPQFGISTAEAYTLFSGLGVKPQTKKNKEQGFFNRFEELLFEQYPELQSIQKTLLDIGCDYVLLSGSGSAMLGFVNNKKNIDKIFQKAEASFNDSAVFKAKYILS